MAADRDANELEPHTRCKASGALRQFLTPYGVEILELPEMQRAFIFDIGGPHTFRTIYMDGRSHPEEPRRRPTTAIGSAGGTATRWSWTRWATTKASGWTAAGCPTPTPCTRWRSSRAPRFNTMRYEYTVDDPGAYTKPFTGAMNLRWEAGTELFEYQCQQANYAHELMVGEYEKVDRPRFIVP